MASFALSNSITLIFMYNKLKALILLALTIHCAPLLAQNLPGDSVSFGPMFSVVYHDSVRVWVLTKNNTGSGNTFTLEVRQGTTGAPMTGIIHDSDTRLGYFLRSYTYGGLVAGQTYNATIKRNGTTVIRSTSIKNTQAQLTDFEFLAGGCGRIMDTTRCVDKYEGMSHINGTPNIYKQMAGEGSDLMVWLGDAVYLFGIEHSGGTCPGMVNDWDNRDALFSRYYFNRQFHDTLLRAMPQLAITDNHDVGGNEFNKTMATLNLSKQNFMNWWQNPEYKSNPQGQGLYSSYKYKDVEFFLLDNRSYRESTTRHLGPDQMVWLRQALLSSTATFKVLISGTPSFDKRGGGRNFSITAECDTIVKFIKANNIDGVLCYSADIHAQEFYGRYNDHTYPFFDVLSGNLASDIGSGNTSITPDNDDIFNAVIQTYTRTNVYGALGNRRYKVEYMSPNGVRYYGAIIHEDMLKSIDDSTKKLALSFTNSLYDSSKYHRTLQPANITYTTGRNGQAATAIAFGATSSVTIPHSAELDMHDRTFSIPYWIKPAQLPATGYAAIFSNSTGNNGYTIGVDAAGHSLFINHATNQTYTTAVRMRVNDWAHVTWKYDNIKLQLSFYWNGRMLQRWSGVASSDSSAGDLYLGNNYANNHFVGALDAFTIYGKLISDKKIQALSDYTPTRGSAIALSGGQNMYLPSAQVNSIFSGAFTTEFWARFTGNVAGPIVSTHGRINNQTTGWDIEFSNSKPNVVFGNNSTTGWLKIVEAGYPWQLGEWNHMAVTAVPNDSLYLYVNGNKVGSVKYTTYYANTFGFGLAKSSQYNSTAPVEMDEFRIWNAAQSADSIRKRMHYKMTGTEPNLSFYYDFNAHTDTTIISKGSNNTELLLSGATLIPSTAPNTIIAPAYRSVVTGSWTIRKNANTGLNLKDTIIDFTANFIAGKNPDTTIAPVAVGSNIHYLKGGWQLNALNIPVGTLSLNLSQSLPRYDSIVRIASEYYLLKEDTGNALIPTATGYYDGQSLHFMNAILDTGIYHIGWKADTGAALFNRGNALSVLGNHAMGIPAAGADAALSGPFTIEFWGRLMAVPNKADNNSILSNNGRVGGNSRGISIEFPRNSTLPHITTGTNGSGWNSLYAAKAWELGEWNHVAVTFNPNDSIRLYMNGALVGANAVGSFYSGASNLAMGSSFIYSSEVVGMMDELRIWKRVKSTQEINNGMHLSINNLTDTSLAYNYTFNEAGTSYIHNAVRTADSIALVNAKIVPATSPVASIDLPQQYHVTGSWSIRDSANNGLSVLVAIPDYETNLIMGKDSLTGSSNSPTVQNLANLRTLWQLDPLKISNSAFTFDGPTVLGSNWTAIRNIAIEYYLLKQDAMNQLVVQAVGNESNNKISFSTASLSAGKYTLGWKSQTTGMVETEKNVIQFFPNPTQNNVTINGLNTEDVTAVYVHDINGQRVQVTTQTTGKAIRMDVSRLSAGTYVVVVVKKDGTKSALKLMKL